MSEIRYNNPQENVERGDDAWHTLEIEDEAGVVIARAEINYYSKPIPFYQLTDLYTEPEHQGKGLASSIMAAFEAKLKKSGRAGFLVDAILPEDKSSGMYERRGWIPVPNGMGQYVFNLPKGVGPEKFIGVEMRQTPIEERSV